MVQQTDWQDALATTLERFEDWYDQTDLTLVYAQRPSAMPHHGCPPPLPPGDDHCTATFWQDRPILWADPAVYGEQIVRPIPKEYHVQVACMGTMFWFVAHTFKELGMEDQISLEQWRHFKAESGTNYVDGFAQAAVELGWAGGITTNVEEIEFGDLAGIQKNGEIHHWCIAWDQPHDRSENGTPILVVLGAAPRASEDACPVGLEDRDKTWEGRGWVAAKMFR